jgi:hypothetical protein
VRRATGLSPRGDHEPKAKEALVCESKTAGGYSSSDVGFLALGPVSSKNCGRIAINNPNTPKKSRPSFRDPVSLSIQPATSGVIAGLRIARVKWRLLRAHEFSIVE